MSSSWITSRQQLPDAAGEVEANVWFNLWQTRQWPYSKLHDGDRLYWYESCTKQLRWRSLAVEVTAFPYDSLPSAINTIERRYRVKVDRQQPYLVGKPSQGFCLAFRAEGVTSCLSSKPDGLALNRLGWDRVDRAGIDEWIAGL